MISSDLLDHMSLTDFAALVAAHQDVRAIPIDFPAGAPDTVDRQLAPTIPSAKGEVEEPEPTTVPVMAFEEVPDTVRNAA